METIGLTSKANFFDKNESCLGKLSGLFDTDLVNN